MKLFIDANILVSVLNKEYPLFTYASRILSLADSKNFEVYTSPVCLAIAFYFAEKKYKSQSAKQRISLLCDHILIADTNSSCVSKTLANSSITDFEDGLEYYSAAEKLCDCIVTEDINDFYFSTIEVITAQDFFNKYMAKGKSNY